MESKSLFPVHVLVTTIFVMPAEGGLPKRLTFHSSPDIISSWTAPDKILFFHREFKQIERPIKYAR
jgi:hypothetical protein